MNDWETSAKECLLEEMKYATKMFLRENDIIKRDILEGKIYDLNKRLEAIQRTSNDD